MADAAHRAKAVRLAHDIDRIAGELAADALLRLAHGPAPLRRIMLEAVARKLLRAAHESPDA